MVNGFVILRGDSFASSIVRVNRLSLAVKSTVCQYPSFSL